MKTELCKDGLLAGIERSVDVLLDTGEKLLTFMEKAGIGRVTGADWHEPDQAGVSAEVRGNHLDNAMGDGGECGEFAVFLKWTDEADESNTKIQSLNLATLLALAAK